MKEISRLRRRGRRQEFVVLGFLLTILTVLTVWFLVVFNQEREQEARRLLRDAFVPGQSLRIRRQIKKNHQGQSLKGYQNKLGVVKKAEIATVDWKQVLVYQVRFSDKGKTIPIAAKDLQETATTYTLGQTVEVKEAAQGEDEGRISQVELGSGKNTEEAKYTVRYNKKKLSGLPKEKIALVHHLALAENNTAASNNQLIQEAIDLSQVYPSVVIKFPKGRFKIGSQTPDRDYILLASNTELRGRKTDLIVEGTAYWFALATGAEATQGVSNFTMTGLDFTASDLTNGSHFMVMANHGNNWRISNNSFTMVHKISSHIFDLGGLQNSIFDSNRFIGYAPELVNVTDTKGRSAHDFYSEAIQLDYSDANQIWDAGLLKPLDPNYDVNNAVKQLSSNIQITNNQFSAYKGEDGSIKAYSATIGQHSSKVGMVSIYNNQFTDLLTERVKPPKRKEEMFEAVHVDSDEAVDIHSNSAQ